jgi:hypothetical protein
MLREDRLIIRFPITSKSRRMSKSMMGALIDTPGATSRLAR